MKNIKLLQKQKSLLIILIGSCLISYHVYKLNRSVESDILGSNQTHNLIAAKAIDPILNKNTEKIISLSEEDSDLSQKTEVFQNKLEDMRICLELDKANPDTLKPTFDNLYQFVMNDFGNSFSQTQEWSNTHLTLPSGEERRIRIEIEGVSEEKAEKKLSYYELDSEKLPLKIPLTAEQSSLPTEQLFQNLSEQGKVIFKESASNTFFANGQHIYFTEKNGLLANLEIQNTSGRIFKCNDVTSVESQCRCL